MSQEIKRKPLTFHQREPRTKPYLILILLFLIVGAVWVLMQVRAGEIQSPFMPTPTPTRVAQSYILQAQTYFEAGKLDDPNSPNDAIDTYKEALAVDPENATVMAELARIQTYSSRLLSTDQERLQRLEEARDYVRNAAELAPDDSTILALKAFVLDWNASSNLITSDQRDAYLIEAEAAANRAYLLDPENALALAFYGEVLLDQQRWDQAIEYASQAVESAPDLMDTHRVYATVLESIGAYRDAINEYKKAAEISPNLTFLLLQIGLGYRNLQDYNTALYYFDQSAQINEQLGVRDPTPYIAIAKAYTQQGEFYAASLNAQKALSYAPTSADVYGQLGSIYVQARNYESALPTLRCAIEGCSAQENQTAQELMKEEILPVDQAQLDSSGMSLDDFVVSNAPAVKPLELTNLTVAYYYIRYGSVLAYLSNAQNGYCQTSMALMAQLREKFPEDTLLMENVSDNEATCQLLAGSQAP